MFYLKRQASTEIVVFDTKILVAAWKYYPSEHVDPHSLVMKTTKLALNPQGLQSGEEGGKKSC